MRARLGVAAATALLLLSPLSMPVASADQTQPTPPPISGSVRQPVRTGIGDWLCVVAPWFCGG